MNWTTQWPTQRGWYWTWIEGDLRDDRPYLKPVQIVLSGSNMDQPLYLRDGHFFYKSEIKTPVWWLPLREPESALRLRSESWKK